MSFNKIILMGNLTRDPALSYLPSQTPVVDIGVAVNHRYKTNDGQQREDVCFIDCRSMGKTAETINQYFKKGQSILIEGRLDFDQWEAQDGTKRSKHRVFIQSFSFVGQASGGNESGNNQQSNPYQPKPYPKQQYDQSAPASHQDPPAGGGEEIPF